MIEKIKKVIKPARRKEANVEAEKGETIVTYLFGISIPEHYRIDGKKHEQGGTPLKVPDGSFVFSDDKKMIVDDPNILKFFGESKPKTPARIAKKYELNEYKAKLIDPNTDQITKVTSALMLKNNYEKLAQLALYQEAKKGFKDGVPKFAEDYLLSIGIEPNELLEIVKGKMEKKIYKNPQADEEGNPVMQHGGDPTNPYDKNKIIQEKKALFDKWIEDFKKGKTEFSLGNINPNLNKQVYEAFLDYARSKGLNIENVNFVSKNPSFQDGIGYSTGSFLAVADNQQPTDVKSQNEMLKELEFNIEDVNKRLMDSEKPIEEVNVPLSNTNNTKSDKKLTGVIEEPIDNKPVLQNITEPKGKDVAEKRKWLESEEGKKWLESEDGKKWLQSEDGKKYQQELRYKKLSSIANKLLPNEPIEITIGGMDGIANLSMLATEASKWNLGRPRPQQFSADNVFQPVKGIDRGDYSAAGSTYGQFRPNEQTPKYTESIPYQKGGGVKEHIEKLEKQDNNKKINLMDRIKNYLRNKMSNGGEPKKDKKDEIPDILKFNIEDVNKRLMEGPIEEVTLPSQNPEISNNKNENKETNIEEQYKPKIKRKYYTQDIRNIAAALGQLAGIKMYLPWSAPIDYMVPRAVYYDPTREIQGAATIASTQGKLMQAYLSPQNAMANMGEQQARLAEQVANMVASAQQRNVGIANQMEQQRASIYNQIANMERARQQELYNQTIAARQQYDNARRKALAAYIAALNQADENAARAYNLSNIVFADSPFYIDPATGQIEIDKSRVKLDKSKTPDKPLEEKIKESYGKYKEASIPNDVIEKLIIQQYFGNSGKDTKRKEEKESESEKNIKKQAKEIYEASLKSSSSKKTDEENEDEEKKYGGEVGVIISFFKNKYLS